MILCSCYIGLFDDDLAGEIVDGHLDVDALQGNRVLERILGL